MCIFAPQSLQKSKPDRGWISPSPLGRLTGAFSKIRCTVSKSLRLIIGSCTFSVMCHWLRSTYWLCLSRKCFVVLKLTTSPQYSCRVRILVKVTLFHLQRLSSLSVLFLQVPRPRSFM